MSNLLLHPGLVLIIGGMLMSLCAPRLRTGLQLGLPLLALFLVWQIPDGVAHQLSFMDQLLTPIRSDALSRLFATIFALMAAVGGLYALNQPSRLEIAAAYGYAGSAIGVCFAGDLLTLFVFWELMAIGSSLVLWSSGTTASGRAAQRYILIHILGGVLLFAGIAGHVQSGAGLEFSAMRADNLSNLLILAGMLVNAGAPPFSAWLPDAYPEASWSGTVFLSAFTTKTAVYTLIRGFPGNEILIWIGLFMVFYGIVYALLENDMRRILAYSIVNQVGFMVAGIGIGTEMALNGAAAHAFTHIIYKALLLMSAGAVLMQTARSKCSELGGLFHSMPLTTVCACIGALAISSFPLTSGFVSKSMVTQAAADGHLLWVWLLMTAASAGTFFYAGIKFPWFVFFQKDSGLRPAEPALSMRLAMLILSALCIVIGVWPELLYRLLPFEVNYAPYTAGHVIAQLQLLLFSGLAFFVLLGYLKRTPTITLDTDWFWRRALPGTASWLAQWRITIIGLCSPLERWVSRFSNVVSAAIGVRGPLSGTWSLATMGLAVVILLIVQLVVVMS
ncbi:MAG: Na(+)/H(+) antiporter subunit D [Betaproteobacteria bacterium]|nr:Na(+)/H(+) antiporter subunit D [Betaproteobacteria bacterium]